MMKQLLYLIFGVIILFNCNSESHYKTIGFESFEITVPQNWNKFVMKGIDSYVGGIITEEKDTLIFDIGMYSGDVSKDDLPLVYDKKMYAELNAKEKEMLKKAKHLVVDSISGNINFKDYLTQKSEVQKIDCFTAKLITPINKEFGTTGIYIDSLEGNGKNFNKIRMSFYGYNLKEKTQIEFVKALQSIKFKEYCH